MTKDFNFTELERTLEILKIKMHVKDFADFVIQKDFYYRTNRSCS